MTIDVPRACPPRPFHWTCRLFHTAGDFGLFEGHRAMLIDGVLHEEGQETPPHGCSRSLVADTFYHAFPGCHLRQRSPLVLSDRTDPVPDVSVVHGRIRDATDHPRGAVFVAEVADHSLAFDTTVKGPLYAAAGVEEYWVVDLTDRALLVFRDPAPVAGGGHAYRTQLVLAPTDTVSPLAAPQAVIAVADLLP